MNKLSCAHPVGAREYPHCIPGYLVKSVLSLRVPPTGVGRKPRKPPMELPLCPPPPAFLPPSPLEINHRRPVWPSRFASESPLFAPRRAYPSHIGHQTISPLNNKRPILTCAGRAFVVQLPSRRALSAPICPVGCSPQPRGLFMCKAPSHRANRSWLALVVLLPSVGGCTAAAPDFSFSTSGRKAMMPGQVANQLLTYPRFDVSISQNERNGK